MLTIGCTVGPDLPVTRRYGCRALDERLASLHKRECHLCCSRRFYFGGFGGFGREDIFVCWDFVRIYLCFFSGQKPVC